VRTIRIHLDQRDWIADLTRQSKVLDVFIKRTA